MQQLQTLGFPLTGSKLQGVSPAQCTVVIFVILIIKLPSRLTPPKARQKRLEFTRLQALPPTAPTVQAASIAHQAAILRHLNSRNSSRALLAVDCAV